MDEVRDAVTATLRELGACAAAPIRTILIQNGYFVGHKYRFHDGGYAVWLLEKKAIEIYDNDGELLKTVSLEVTEGEKAA